MLEALKNDTHRMIIGKPYQLFLFENGYELDMYDMNADEEDKSALIGRYESDTAFLPIHAGDILDGRPLGFDMAIRFQVERVEHQIDTSHGVMKHRLVLFVTKALSRQR